ncbi:MAG: hypothetical protein QME59_07055 [Candidatus Hydrothermarchaeota archaeon]|nr:hypothetical protein [Candidatus Hydrothermarchaeota archaeon]
MPEVIRGVVRQGIIKPEAALKEEEEVLILRVEKPKTSKVDRLAKKFGELQDHSLIEEIIESTESGEGID